MESNRKEVLNPDHKLWQIFRRKLGNVVSIYADGKLHNQCSGDLALTIEILESMENIDIKETLIVMREFGGSCDCKVIANVGRIWRNSNDDV